MIFKPWTRAEFEAKRFAQVGAASPWALKGVPLYASSRSHREVWIPEWAADLLYGLELNNNRRLTINDDAEFARLSAAAIKSDDPDAFVEMVLAAYALGGWRAALALAGAQDEAHVA